MHYKKIAAAAMALLLTVSGGTGAAELQSTRAHAATAGDLNGDGVVSIADMVTLQKFLLGQGGNLTTAADLNGDGKINGFDATRLKQILLGSYKPPTSNGLYINEVCTQNDTNLTDADGAYSDWIELYNSTNQPMDISGYGLSDKAAKPMKWVFPAGTTVPANGYLVVFASGKDLAAGGELHTSFKLSKDGETVVLTGADGTCLDTLTVPALKGDVTYGRFKNGSANLTKLTPTPGKSNDTATELREVAMPTFSKQSGFYQSGFTVDIKAESGLKVYYTLDGSDPTTSATAYTAGLSVNNRTNEPNVYAAIPDQSVYSDYIPTVNINKATILRAVAVDADGFVSNIATASYFVGIDIGATYQNYPVVSIVSDPDGLFSDPTGIFVKGDVYKSNQTTDPWGGGGFPGGWGGMAQEDGSTPANYNQRGETWERPAHIDFFEGDGSLGFSQDIGIRTMGGWSRAYLQKNIRCYARGDYGASKFNYDLIPGLTMESDATKPLNVFDTFLLRAGGNDAEYTKLRDVFIQQLVEDRKLDTQGSRICIVYLDGEYWGVYNIQEDYNDDYIQNNYGIDKDEVIIVKVGSVDEGEESDATLYQELLSFAQNNDLSTDANYEKICQMIDIDNFIDYFCTEIYIANADWPGNNYRLWRTRNVVDDGYGDGRWRWMLYDTEMSMDIYNFGKNASNDTLSPVIGKGGGMFGGATNDQSTILMRSLVKNKAFCEKFVNTMMDIRNSNFAPTATIEKLEGISALYRPVMEDQFARFGPSNVVQKYNPATKYFDEHIEGMKNYLKNRYTYVPNMLKSGFSLQGNAVDVTVQTNNAAAGSVKVNTTQIDLSGGSWVGQYFTDYPITLTATPTAGHKFTGWSGGSTSTAATITVPLSTAITLTANFS